MIRKAILEITVDDDEGANMLAAVAVHVHVQPQLVVGEPSYLLGILLDITKMLEARTHGPHPPVALTVAPGGCAPAVEDDEDWATVH